MKSIVTNAIGEVAVFKCLDGGVEFYSFAKEKAFQVLKEKITDGFFFLIKRAQQKLLRTSDIALIKRYLYDTCQSELKNAMRAISGSNQLFVDFSNDYTTAIKVKTYMETQIFSLSYNKLNDYCELFRHQPEYEYNSKRVILLKSEEYPWFYSDVDIAYWRKFALATEDPGLRSQRVSAVKWLDFRKDLEVVSLTHRDGAWSDFLSHHPDRATDAIVLQYQARDVQYRDFEVARQTGSREGWQKYINHHPNGPYASEIEASIARGEVFDPLRGINEAERLAAKRIAAEAAEHPSAIKRIITTLEHLR